MQFQNQLFIAYKYTKDNRCAPTYGEYSSLASAKRACNADSNYRVVVDRACHDSDRNIFRLCPRYLSFITNYSSCTYEKGK